MEILGVLLVVYGAFILLGYMMQFPFLYNNLKSKALIKMMGKTWFNIILLIIGITTLTFGIIILS
jgi:hypothetical protein